MLTLPQDWATSHAGYLAVKLLQGIDGAADRIECSRALIWASLRLWMATERSPQSSKLKCVNSRCWHVGRLRYRFIPEMNDSAFFSFVQMRRNVHRDFYIVPAESDCLFGLAAKAELGDRKPQIFSVNSFLSWRLFFATADSRRSYEELMADFVTIYNQCVKEIDRDDLMIDYVGPNLDPGNNSVTPRRAKMRPDGNLREQLQIAWRILRQPELSSENDEIRLADLVVTLDESLRNRGKLPKAWTRSAAAKKPKKKT